MSLRETSIEAIKKIREGNDPNQAWKDAVKKYYPHSMSMQKKDCPRNAFLGLCSEGLVKGVDPGDYTDSEKNKSYAITAINLLKGKQRDDYTARSLWFEVLLYLNKDPKKQHNGQMDVVLALWNERLIK